MKSTFLRVNYISAYVTRFDFSPVETGDFSSEAD